MKQIKIPDKLYNDLRAFTDKQGVPLKTYIEGVLETSMFFPDGIDIPESFTAAQKEQLGLANFKGGIHQAIKAILKSENWIFEEMADMLEFVTIGTTNLEINQCNVIDLKIEPCILARQFQKALKASRIAALDLDTINRVYPKK